MMKRFELGDMTSQCTDTTTQQLAKLDCNGSRIKPDKFTWTISIKSDATTKGQGVNVTLRNPTGTTQYDSTVTPHNPNKAYI